MIKNDIVKYVKKLRKTLLKLAYNVDDSTPYTYFIGYTPQPSSSDYKHDVQNIIQEIMLYAERFGLYIVDVYGHVTGNFEEAVFDTKNILDKNYYKMEQLKSKHSNYSELIYIDEREIKCPACRKEKKLHKIYKGYIIKDDNVWANYFKDVIKPLIIATQYCCYKGKRSKIRENILNSIVSLDNLLIGSIDGKEVK